MKQGYDTQQDVIQY